MSPNEDKTRIVVYLPIKLKEEIEQKAKACNRSVSNYIVNTLCEKIESEKK